MPIFSGCVGSQAHACRKQAGHSQSFSSQSYSVVLTQLGHICFNGKMKMTKRNQSSSPFEFSRENMKLSGLFPGFSFNGSYSFVNFESNYNYFKFTSIFSPKQRFFFPANIHKLIISFSGYEYQLLKYIYVRSVLHSIHGAL